MTIEHVALANAQREYDKAIELWLECDGSYGLHVTHEHEALLTARDLSIANAASMGVRS